METLKQLYYELISDYDPYEDLKEHKSYSLNNILYNLIEIRENNFDYIEDIDFIKRFDNLIELFKAAGISPE